MNYMNELYTDKYIQSEKRHAQRLISLDLENIR